ncbi:MAG: thioesterase [Paludibacteraceae bacterium]|nr:thioesterase [Paludibacteraceae bacterium]
MKQRYTFHVHYADVDIKCKIKPYILEEQILNIACRAADDCGFGIPDLNREGKSWVLARLQVAMDEYPILKDDIEVETWIESNRFSFSTRNFRLWRCTDGQHELIGVCKSIWAIIDLKTRENVNIFGQEQFARHVDGEKIQIAAFKHPDKNTIAGEYSYTIQYSDIDQNGHCNSARYMQIITNAFGKTYVPSFRHFQISYSHEVRFGECIKVKYTPAENDNVQVLIYNSTGDLCTSAILIK